MIKDKLQKHEFWDEYSINSSDLSDSELFEEIKNIISPLPTLLDKYFIEHPLLFNLISILKQVHEKDFEYLKTFSGLPNSCKSIVYCLMLAY